MAAISRAVRTPPEAFTPILFPTHSRIRRTASTVAPPVEKPVDVFTKSAPAAKAQAHALRISSSVSRQISKITFTKALPSAAATTALMSASTPAQSPSLAKPIFMTISTSSAPFAIASFVSKALAEEVAAPRGNPITVQTFTSVPANCAFAKATRAGFTHTEQNPYSAASSQSRATCACVA